jgi:hypothetical protein
MAPLANASRTFVRSVQRCCQAPASIRALSTTAVRADDSSSYSSPFKGESTATKIPDFSHYRSKNAGSTNQLFSYFMVGTLGAISAAGAKSTIQGECGVVMGSSEHARREFRRVTTHRHRIFLLHGLCSTFCAANWRQLTDMSD